MIDYMCWACEQGLTDEQYAKYLEQCERPSLNVDIPGLNELRVELEATSSWDEVEVILGRLQTTEGLDYSRALAKVVQAWEPNIYGGK